MAKRGDGVRVLSAFFAGVLLAGTCARVASEPVPTPRASVDATPLVWATRVDLATEEAYAREETAHAAHGYELQEGEPPLVEDAFDALETQVVIWARSRCSRSEDDTYRYSVRETLAFEDSTFAIVVTPCLLIESGAYNHLESVVAVSGSGVRTVRFAPLPAWATELGFELSDHDTERVWNPGLEVRNGLLYLNTGSRSRGLGDGGEEALFVLRGGRFEILELRERAESAIVPVHIGPFPIVGPPERRCSAALEVGEGRDAALVLRTGERSRRLRFTLADDGCEARYGSSIVCGGSDLDPDAGYGLTASGGDWLAVRVGGDGEREVFRAPRGCAL